MFSISSSLLHKHSYMRLWNPHTSAFLAAWPNYLSCSSETEQRGGTDSSIPDTGKWKELEAGLGSIKWHKTVYSMGRNKNIPLCWNKSCLDLTGWHPHFKLKVWLYFPVNSAADLHQEVLTNIKNKTSQTPQNTQYKIYKILVLSHQRMQAI